MSHNHLFTVPAKPERITLDTLPELFAHNRARFGGWSMTAGQVQPDPEPPAGQQQNTPPERPDGVSEVEWNALGDPGRAALTREREARQAAERALAASRARPNPPGGPAAKTPEPKPADAPKVPEPPKPGEVDVAAIVKQAVEAAVAPFREAEERRQTETAAERVRAAVLDAAKPVLHDATDALTGIDLAGVVNDQGVADTDKVKSALEDLVKRKPHLAKAPQRVAPNGIGGGGPVGATDAEKVKAVLADMQRSTGVRLPASTSTN